MKNEEFHETARKLLLAALDNQIDTPPPPESLRYLIDTVIEGHHKTYRYILFTAITAKAANPKLNPIVLQKGATTWGTYDARSLCHKVLVPFEREYLNNALGGSNEPFLNKPARFPVLSPANAVRNGKDRKLLNLLCSTLPEITSGALALASLRYLMEVLLRKAEATPQRFTGGPLDHSAGIIEVRSFLERFLRYNHGGEVLTLTLAAVLNELLKDDPSYRIEVHNLNQSGASSREISDLDLYKDEKIFALFELKDKSFNIADIQHAVGKAIDGGCYSLNFIYGRSATFNRESVEEYCRSLTEDSFYLNVASIDTFIKSLLIFTPALSLASLINYMLDTARSCRFSHETTVLLLDIASEYPVSLDMNNI